MKSAPIVIYGLSFLSVKNVNLFNKLIIRGQQVHVHGTELNSDLWSCMNMYLLAQNYTVQ